MVSVNPGTLATPVHNIGASTRVTVNLSGGWLFTRIVIFAPPANGPSILDITMTSPGHSAAFVHTAHTSSALAEEWDDPPNGPFALPMSVIFPRFDHRGRRMPPHRAVRCCFPAWACPPAM